MAQYTIDVDCPDCCGCSWWIFYVTIQLTYDGNNNPITGTASGYAFAPYSCSDYADVNCGFGDKMGNSDPYIWVHFPESGPNAREYGVFSSVDESKTLCFATYAEAQAALDAMPYYEKVIDS